MALLIGSILLVLNCQIGWAQSLGSDSFEKTEAMLSITVLHNEDADVWLSYEADKGMSSNLYSSAETFGLEISPEQPLIAAIKSGFKCGQGRFHASSDKYGFSIDGRCSVAEPSGWQWADRIDLQPLLSELSDMHVEQLYVALYLPSIGASEVSPAGDALPSANLAPHYVEYTLDTAQPTATTISYRYGFTQQQIGLRAGLLVGLLILPIGGVWWLQSRTLKTYARTGDRTLWFGYQRSLTWIETATWIVWLTAFYGLGTLDWLPLLLPAGIGQVWSNAIVQMSAIAIPSLVGAINQALSHRVTKNVGQIDYTLSELVGQYVAAKSLILLPLLIIFLAPLLYEKDTLAFIILGTAGFSAAICTAVLQKLNDRTPYAVTTGELRDRIFQLAKQTGVEIKHIYLLPMKRSRMVNAFAAKNGTVMMTDCLLEQLNKDEVDAIMAHELAHLQLNHLRKKLLALSGICFLAFCILPIFISLLFWTEALSLATQVPVSVLIVFLFANTLSRRYEYQADAQAATTIGNPQALITGLIKTARLNHSPLQWSRLCELMMTHPSMQRRVEAIAQQHDLPKHQLKPLIEQAQPIPPDSKQSALSTKRADRYPLSDLLTVRSTGHRPSPDSQHPLFSTVFRQRVTSRFSTAVLLCFTLFPVLLSLIVQTLPTPGLRWIGHLIAAVCVVALYRYLLRTAPAWGYQKLAAQLSQRLHSEGFDTAKGTFVGFAPSAESRSYEGHSNWDVGWLFLVQGNSSSLNNRLCYIGEQVRFALTAEQISQIETPSPCRDSLIPNHRIAIGWQRDTQQHPKSTAPHIVEKNIAEKEQRFSLQTLEITSLKQLRPMTRSLEQAIKDWQIATQPATCGVLKARRNQPREQHEPNEDCPFKELRPPTLGDVSSLPLGTFSIGQMMKSWLYSVAVALVATSFMGGLWQSTASTGFVLLMVTLGTALQHAPALRRSVFAR